MRTRIRKVLRASTSPRGWSHGRLLISALVGAAISVAAIAAPSPFNRFAPSLPAHGAGQSVTLLPDGHYLLVGGSENGTVLPDLRILDSATSVTAPEILPSKLSYARSGHTATVLPNGMVLIFGGYGPDGSLVQAAELFDPGNKSVSVLPPTGLTARAQHSATLLTNGLVLLAGGIGEDGRLLNDADLFNPVTQRIESTVVPLGIARADHNATLLPNGRGLVWGGNGPADVGNLYDPTQQRFSAVNWWDEASLPQVDLVAAAPAVAASIPQSGATDVQVESLVAVRFSRPLDVKSLTGSTVTLIGPGGAVSGKVVGAENGMLLFFSPLTDLLPATTYTAFFNGVTDVAGRALPFSSFSFTTRWITAGAVTNQTPAASGTASGVRNPAIGLNGSVTPGTLGQVATAQSAIEEAKKKAEEDLAEDWVPQEANRHNSWRVLGLSGDPALDINPVTDLVAANGVTAISGRVLKLNGRPLSGATISNGSAAAITDVDGRFLLVGVTPGLNELKIDGTTAWTKGRHYTKHFMRIDVVRGATTRLGSPVFLPRVNPAAEVSISSPSTKELVLTDPSIPGLEVHVPKGAVLREYDGRIVTKLSITPIPVDRAPYLTPVKFSVYFTLQPGGAFVDGDPDKVVRIIYPNYEGLAPGTSVDFWNYDPTEGWRIYGKGVISADGKKVIPNDDLGFRQIMTFGYGISGGGSTAPPADGPPPGGCVTGGDPVDCATGLFLHTVTDLALKDVIPIALTRTYRPNDVASRAFGVGTSMPYSMYLYTSSGASIPTPVNLVLPDGGQIHYVLQSGTSLTNAVWKNTDSPTSFLGSVLRGTTTQTFTLTLKDGTVLTFGTHSKNQLMSIADRYGNTVTLTLANGVSGGNVTQITSPNGRFISLSYDASNRVTQATDNIGRTVLYHYDASSRLDKVTDPNGNFEQYAYDASNRMTAVTDKRGHLMVTNEYDANGRVFRQTLADNAVWQFAYTLSNGKVIQTDVTDPRNVVRRVSFNSSGYLTQEIRALGQPEQQTYVYQRNSTSNLVTSVTDALNRQTTLAYDSVGNITGVTRLAGTVNAVTYGFTYDLTFSRLASSTDPLGHSSQLAYDPLGNLLSVTDPLGHQISISSDGQGLPTAITDALSHTTTVGYQQGDLSSTTDALGHTANFFTDGAGRWLSLIDGLGNRTQYNIDPMDRLLSVTDALNGVTSMSYDANGNLLSVTDPRNVGSHGYEYDPRNRVQTYTDPLGKQESYVYDGLGNLTAKTDRKNQVTQYIYDALNRLTTITFQDNSTINITRDAGDRPTQIVDSVNGTISRQYEGLDRLTQEITPQGQVNYVYDAAGRRTQMTVAGSTPVSYAYDNANRVTSITQGSAVVTPVYDNANRRTGLTLPNGVLSTYSYDNADQLTGIGFASGQTSLGTISYGYDNAGRRTSRVSSIDHAGLPPTVGAAADAASYTWNARNQLASLSGAVADTFNYDALGRRSGKTIAGTSTNFLYDGANLVRELNGTNPTANYLTGLNVDEAFSRTDSSATSSFLTDGINSTVALSNSTGTLTTNYTYDAYGNTTTSGAASSNPLQFTGRENDSTGLYYYRARYYNPVLGRFISSDPIGLVGGINTYAYVGGDPVSFIDPWGLASVTTDMAGHTTTFDPRPEDPNGVPFTIPTRNGVDSHALPGAADGFSTPDVSVTYRGQSTKTYGPDGADINTGDVRHRDIHGGGSCPANQYGNPIDSNQGWCVTMGCTRGQNQDVLDLAKRITDFQARHPGTPIPYLRY